MQARVGALRQKAAGVVLMAGDALTGHMRGVGVAVIRVVAHGQSAVVEDRDRRGVTEQRSAHGILLFRLCCQSG
ncbi:C component of insecticidal toxin complex [Salmonella enterica]|nr:C component of insecticidal toxin complex [Salmonella enterica]